jgi:hypothetical protein
MWTFLSTSPDNRQRPNRTTWRGRLLIRGISPMTTPARRAHRASLLDADVRPDVDQIADSGAAVARPDGARAGGS